MKKPTRHSYAKDHLNGRIVRHGDVVAFPDTETEYDDFGVGAIAVAQINCNALAVVVQRGGQLWVRVTDRNETISRGEYRIPVFLRYLKESLGTLKAVEVCSRTSAPDAKKWDSPENWLPLRRYLKVRRPNHH